MISALRARGIVVTVEQKENHKIVYFEWRDGYYSLRISNTEKDPIQKTVDWVAMVKQNDAAMRLREETCCLIM